MYSAWSCWCRLPGRTADAAREAFLAPLRRCLSCVTDAQLYAAPSGEPEALALSENPLLLNSTVLPTVRLQLRQQYRLVHNTTAVRTEERWHVSTTAYQYRLDGERGEVLSWHWHPAAGVSYPHVHVSGDVSPLTRRMHLPTGRVSIESVLRLLLAEWGVPPRRDDWSQVLGEAESGFLEHRRWSGHSPDYG